MRKLIFFRHQVILALIFCLFALPVAAQLQAADDGWDHSLAVYLWGAGIDGTT